MKKVFVAGLSTLTLMTLVFSSCKTTQTTTVKRTVSEMPAMAIIDSCKVHSKFNYLGAKVAVQYDRNGDSKNFNVRARLKADSIIWISIAPAMGIEVMRFCLTPDSVKLVNRIDQTYIASTFDEANEKLNLSEDFNLIQALITGMFATVYDQKVYVSTVAGANHLLEVGAENTVSLKDRKGISHQTMISSANWRILSTLLSDSEKKQSIEASYGAFETFGNFAYPTDMHLVLKGEGQLTVHLNWSKVELPESLDFPFSIPDKYAPVN